MLRTRLLVGTLLIVLVGSLLAADESFGSPYFGLLTLSLLLGVFGTRELIRLFPPVHRPRGWLAAAGVVTVLASNWIVPHTGWEPAAMLFAAFVLLTFVLEIMEFREPGHPTTRIAVGVFVVAYLGLLPCFLLKLRWAELHSGLLLALVIAVPKCGDIGAYFTGRAIGRTPFAPLLSPKKTWEGFLGGMLTAVATSVAMGFVGPVFRHGAFEAAAFGFAVGLAGVFGDLAESLIKRDALAKDASATVPGFGGLLDVIDSILFAGPVAYCWVRFSPYF